MKLSPLKFFFLMAALLFAAVSLRAADFSASFDNANKLYEQGHFAESAAAWNNLVTNGTVSGPIFYNEGNALYKAGKIGAAIEAYRKALLLTPRDSELRHNLQTARQHARGGFPDATNRLERAPGYLSLNEWSLLAGVGFFVTFALLAVRQSHFRFPAARFLPWATAFTIIFGLGLLWAMLGGYYSTTAIVSTGEADVRNGPLTESPSLFKVRDGIELKVTDEKDEWLQVQDSAARAGWIRRADTILFCPARLN